VPDSAASMVVHFSRCLPWYSKGKMQGSGFLPIVLQGAIIQQEKVKLILNF
jgi:hypothetical protein